MSKYRVLFIGSNPGVGSPDLTAFHPSCMSRKKLDSWIASLDIHACYVNVVDQKTPGNRPLKVDEIRSALPSLVEKLAQYGDFKIVAVGNAATKALMILGIKDFHPLPHPSGRCRKWNDPDFAAQTRNALISFIKGYNIPTGD